MVDASAKSAAAISASPEAKAHPHMALAAIGSGQTLAQFRANVAAVAQAPKTSKLDVAMAAHGARLGPDAVAPATPTIDAGSIYAKRKASIRRR